MSVTTLSSGMVADRGSREQFVGRQLGAPHDALASFPMYINIETINTCNARCIMCGIDFDKRTLVKLREDLFTKIVAELSKWSDHVRKVNLYFDNEPLLDRDLARKIRALKDAGIRTVSIASNASSLTETRARELIEAGLDQIYITIDSMVPEKFEKIRVGLSFAKVYNNTRNFIRCRDALGGRTAVRVQMVVLDQNEDETDGFIAHWKPLLSSGDCVVCFRAHNWGGAVDVRGQEDDENINALPCTILWSNAMIHADGKVALCSVDTEQKSPYHLGDLNIADSIESIWRGPELAAMRERHLAGRRHEHKLCNGCTVWRENTKDIYVPIGPAAAGPAHDGGA